MLNELIATDVGPSHLDIAYERLGNPAHPTVLLVMGIAAQLVNWPLGFLQALVQRDLHVVRFDNRDSGRSTHLRDAPPADLPAALRGDLSSVAYDRDHDEAAIARQAVEQFTSNVASVDARQEALSG